MNRKQPHDYAGSVIPRPADPSGALAEAVDERWQRYLEAGGAPLTPAALLRVLRRVWAGSEYVAAACMRNPRLLPDLAGGGDLFAAYGPGEYRRAAVLALSGCQDEAALMAALRDLRHRELVRIAWRDLAGWAPVPETLGELSDLAQACIEATLARLHHWQQAEHGVPRGETDGRPQSLVVIAMGKLGARELNFSSDVDLIFAYPDDGATDQGISNQQYFIELGQRLLRVLSETTEGGFAYRTDMRLRPFGESGPLAVSFDALEDYYQSHGRAWERYAMVRGRPITGDAGARTRLMDILRPFVYRRYLDYNTFQELREMKQRIVREVARKGLEHNIKLGAGGIREIEFIVHTFQLIRGGREPELQAPGLLEVIDRLEDTGCLAGGTCADLRSDYLFMRRLENHLQMHDDRQVHSLPEYPPLRSALAYSLGYPDWSALAGALEVRRQRVHEHFTQIIANDKTEDGDPALARWAELWQGTLDEGQALGLLAGQGVDQPREAWELLVQLRQSFSYRAMGTRGREHLDRLMPLVLAAVAACERPALTLRRVVDLLERVGQRTVYLALLAEYPQVLSQLVKLFAASAWIAEYITHHPLLLDELLDPERLYAPLDRAMLRQTLLAQLDRIPPSDLEQQMEALRHFKQAATLRVAAADVTGVFPLIVVSDHLTEIAETVLTEVLDLAWRHLVDKHGRPVCIEQGRRRPAGFAVVGYGKLGGIELGYGSDLDLVFVHDSEGHDQSTDGSKPVENSVFFARLGQRIIHILNTFTPSGVLYEVDMRLRPSGASGLLVSSLASFAEYQRSQAWTWEHQALVRARPVAGDAGIAAHFERIRHDVLTRRRDPEALRAEVVDMRERMRKAHGRRRDGRFDIKQDRGGIADIEFMVQYEVLRWAAERHELTQWTDNIRLLQVLADQGILAGEDAQFLTDAYRFYRSRVHRLTLQDAPPLVSPDEVKACQEGVARLWHDIMERAG